MKKDKVWERLKSDDTEVYGQSMLDMFLRTTEHLERRHWDQLNQNQRRLIDPKIRLKFASTVEEAERAIKEMGLTDIEDELGAFAGYGETEIIKNLVSLGVANDIQGALENAVAWGHADTVRYLLSQGANPDGYLDGVGEACPPGTCDPLGVAKALVGAGAKGIEEALRKTKHMEVARYLRKKMKEGYR